MYYIDVNGVIQEAKEDYFNNEMEFTCFLWKQMYNVNISPYDKQDIECILFLSSIIGK